jgi:hypothetical protein
MGSLSEVRLDLDAVKNGVWKTWRGIRLRIASVDSEEYQKAVEGAAKEHFSRLQTDPEFEQELNRKLVAKHLLKDWEDLEDGGKVIPYSTQKAEEYLLDPTLNPLYMFVLGVAGANQQFLASKTVEGK